MAVVETQTKKESAAPEEDGFVANAEFLGLAPAVADDGDDDERMAAWVAAAAKTFSAATSSSSLPLGGRKKKGGKTKRQRALPRTAGKNGRHDSALFLGGRLDHGMDLAPSSSYLVPSEGGAVVVGAALEARSKSSVAATQPMFGPKLTGRSGAVAAMPTRRGSGAAQGEHAGKSWFGMKRPEMTRELKRDLEVLRMRNYLSAKQFFKKSANKDSTPEYFEVGTVVEGAGESRSHRIPKKQRKKTMVDELLSDRKVGGYAKRKFLEVQSVKQSGGRKSYNDAKKRRQRR